MSPNPTPATVPPAASFRPSPELVNAILKWPEEDRIALARLLNDSVREGFVSLEDAGRRDAELIRERIEAYDRGEVVATDWRESLARVEQQFRETLPP